MHTPFLSALDREFCLGSAGSLGVNLPPVPTRFICPNTLLDMDTTGDDKIWDYFSKSDVQTLKSNVPIEVQQLMLPIIVIGSEGATI